MKVVTTLGVLFLALPILTNAQNDRKPVPTAYNLKLYISDLSTSETFNGSIEMNMTLASASSSILLDAEGLAVNTSSVELYRQRLTGGWIQEPSVDGVSVQEDTLLLNFSEPVAANTKLRLLINYTGRFRSEMRGFAKVPVLSQNQTKYVAVTSLDNRAARAVFPCVDDISLRTVVSLAVHVSRNQVVLSNVMPSSVNDLGESERVFHFDIPAMPVQQLGWIVYEYLSLTLHTTNTSNNATQINTRAPIKYSKHVTWATTLTALLVDAYSNYTRLPYSLDKLEQIVVPNITSELVSGWGLLSLPEESVLMTPGKSSAADAHRVAMELSRGVASQWFQGQLSPSSEDQLWFCKGLSEYLKYTVTAALPGMSSWELLDHMVVDMMQPALALPSNKVSMASNNTEVRQNMYSESNEYKGGAIIRMLHSIIGNQMFDVSLSGYLNPSELNDNIKYRHKNQVELGEFYNLVYLYLLEDKDTKLTPTLGGKTVAEVMEGWNSSMEHPVVSVSWNGTHYNISQSPESRLYVPVTLMVQGWQRVNKLWLRPWPLPTSVLISASDSAWVLVNVNQTGFYRVRYDATLLARLGQQLSADLSKVPRLSRAQLLDDVFSDLSIGHVTPEDLLNLTLYLSNETDYFPWASALRHFQILLDSLYGTNSYSLLQSHLRDKLMRGVLAEVGLEARTTDAHTAKLRQALVLQYACALDHPECVRTAVHILESFLADTFFDADLTPALMCAGVANTDPSVWHQLWGQLRGGRIVAPTLRATALRALACSRDTATLNTFLTEITSNNLNVLSSKDKIICLQTLARTPQGAERLLYWLLETLTNQNIEVEEATTPAPMLVSNSTMNTTSMNFTEFTNTSTTTAPSVVEGDSSVNVTSPPFIARRRREVIELVDKLTEEEIKTVLNLVAPKLTTTEQGAKIEEFLNQSSSGISEETIFAMNELKLQIYKNKNESHKHEVVERMEVWLSWYAAEQATTPGVTPTTPSPPTATTSKPDTTTPGGSSHATSISALLLTATALTTLLLH